CVVGLALFGVGIALIVRGDLGLAPWDVLHQGLAERLDVGIGSVIIVTGGLLLLLWIPLRERPGIGTVLNALEIGLVVGLVLPLLPEPEALGLRAAATATGIVVIAVGSGLYIGAGLGPGPRDGIMTGLARRGLSVRAARTLIEVTVVAAGLALGGSAGVGTIAFALAIGPLVHVLLPRLTMARQEPALSSGSARA
ncbi:MAG: hypothetical protein MUE78_12615, partial [Ilumatobacteraceae bacterium]|nr:hypothetical protein [Ilumatobacteraceae bacterium]